MSSLGRLEILYKGTWGTACYIDDGSYVIAANMVCKQFGYSKAITYGASYGNGNGPIWLNINSLGCSGRESSIIYCKGLLWGVHNCQHQQDFGVTCKDGT